MSSEPVSLADVIGEARRQVEICNACRYCEGFCSVFPAITQQRQFADGDLTQLANLCHNCRGCYYACQYTTPHEFDLNLPQALADLRVESWAEFAWPSPFAKLFQRSGVALGGALIAGIAVIILALQSLRPESGAGFYAFLSHGAMVAIFAPAFVLPLVALAVGVKRYWRTVGGAPLRWPHFVCAATDVARLKDLSGGQGQGCNFENEDRYTNARRYVHQATMWGFFLCFASTSSATLMHYLADWPAPYPLLSVPKLLGVPGGFLLVVGAISLMVLKLKAEKTLGAPSVWGGEMGFVLLLALTGLTGLLLYAATGTVLVQSLFALHLGTVLAFFLTLPYSKMAHGAYRFAALLRDAQLRSD